MGQPTKTMHGTSVAIISLQGKPYVTVAERSRVAHEVMGENDIGGYEIIDEQTFMLNDRYFVRVVILVNGKQYRGTSEIKFNAPPKSADGMSPIECAETSAVGRALAFAGFGAVDSIASADEMVRSMGQGDANNARAQQPSRYAQAQQTRPVPPPQPPVRQASGTVQTGADAMATDRQITSIRKLCAALGRPEPETSTLTFVAAREHLTSLSQAYSEARAAS